MSNCPEQTIKKILELEVKMSEHYKIIEEKNRKNRWLSIMIHSLVQQVFQQNSIYYQTYVIHQADYHHCFIVYLFSIKIDYKRQLI